MRISDWSSDVCSSDLVVAKLLLNTHNLIGGTTSYLVPAVFDRIDPILEVLRPFVRGGPTPFVALCTMNMLLVAPRVRHLDFLLHAAEEWLERLPTDIGMWVELGIGRRRSEEHTSELQSLMRISYAVSCLQKK